MKKRTISLLSLALLGAMVIPGAAFAEEGSVKAAGEEDIR